jgi:hypothetical protein
MFSNSASVKQKELPDLSNINEVVAFFPGLEKLEIPKETPSIKRASTDISNLPAWVA